MYYAHIANTFYTMFGWSKNGLMACPYYQDEISSKSFVLMVVLPIWDFDIFYQFIIGLDTSF